MLSAASGYTNINSAYDLEHCAGSVNFFNIVSPDSDLIFLCAS